MSREARNTLANLIPLEILPRAGQMEGVYHGLAELTLQRLWRAGGRTDTCLMIFRESRPPGAVTWVQPKRWKPSDMLFSIAARNASGS